MSVSETLAPPKPEARRGFLGLPNSSRMSVAQYAYIFTLPTAVILVALNLYPFLYSFWMSLNDIDLRLGRFQFVAFANYAEALSSRDVWQSMGTSFVYAGQVTLYSTVLTVLIALLLNEQFRGRRLLLTISILPWAVSTYAAAVVWRFMLSQENGFFSALFITLGFRRDPINLMDINTALTLLSLAHSWHLIPLGVYFMLATLQVIPQDLYRVARVDRLGVFRRFRHVTFPYLKAPILIILILNTFAAVNVFDLIYFTTGGGPGRATRTMVYEVYSQAFLNLRLGLGAAEGYILMAVVMVITFGYVWVLFRQQKARTLEETQ